MRVLVACEFSGIVRRAFAVTGHNDVMSCDLLPTELPCYWSNEHHYMGDIKDLLSERWDLIIAHPPCTHLAISGARWFKDKQVEQKTAIEFFMQFINASCPKICIENPISIMSTVYRKPDQIIQPWQFGHGETKATCLWLKNLPKLIPTNIVEGRNPRVHYEPPSPERWKNRSRTYQGIADAMANQWSI
jgi:hypothetical protein